MMIQRPKAILILIVLSLAVSSCVPLQTATDLSHEKRYLAARMEFNNLLSRYLLYKSKEPLDVQGIWTEKYDNVFREGALILDTWGMYLSVDDITSSQESQAEFLEFKNSLIDMLMENNVFD